MARKRDAGSVVREIRRKTRRKYSSEEKIRIVLEGLRGEESIALITALLGIPIYLLRMRATRSNAACFERARRRRSGPLSLLKRASTGVRL